MAQKPVGKHGKQSVEQHTQTPRKSPRVSKTALIVLLVVLLLVAAAGIGFFAYRQWQISKAEPTETSIEIPSVSVATTSASVSTPAPEPVKLPDNPVDFAGLQQNNTDICGWINVPNTEINYPILRSSDDAAFYLSHDENGEASGPGSIYMEPANSPKFDDPCTVLYGHDGYGDTMFTTLHYFEDADFFNANPEFTICIPQHILTYRVVSAFMYDNRHILNSFNFNDVATRLQYFSMVSDPDSILVNKRDGITLTETSKIVTLSTCMTSAGLNESRYLVTGVLVNDQQTN